VGLERLVGEDLKLRAKSSTCAVAKGNPYTLHYIRIIEKQEVKTHICSSPKKPNNNATSTIKLNEILPSQTDSLHLGCLLYLQP